MKGIIFNLLEQFITENLGEAVYKEILTDCPIRTQEPFVGPGSYPDEDLLSIMNMTIQKMGLTLPEALRAFGRFCIPKLAERFPDFMLNHNHPKPFLTTIESIHFTELKKLYPEAEIPRFAYEDPVPDRLTIRYTSRRKLCQFMEGLIEGVADFYNSPIRHKHMECMLSGSKECKFDLTFTQERR